MGKKKKAKSDRSTARAGDALFKALTQQEIVHLLDALFEVMSPEPRDRALAQLKPDTRRTVEQILSPSRPSGGPKGDRTRPVSTAKLRKTWSGLWNEWDDIVEEAVQEDGKYIEQEAPWEHPYFDETAVPRKVRKTLFQSWRDHIVRQARPHSWGFGFEKKRDPWWLDWLIESIFDAQKGPPWFQKKVDRWLGQLSKELSSSDEPFDFLRLLTRDLTEIRSREKDRYPTFLKVVVRTGESATLDEKSRQKYLKAYTPGGLLDRVIGYWKEHLHTLVPSPREVHKSDYTKHARWMAALKELAPLSYRALLKEWRVEHERRRNLWQAMENMGLD